MKIINWRKITMNLNEQKTTTGVKKLSTVVPCCHNDHNHPILHFKDGQFSRLLPKETFKEPKPLFRSPGKFSRGQSGGWGGGEGWQRWREGDGVKCGNSLEDSGGRDFPRDTNINQNLIFEIKHSTKWSGHYWEWILFTVKQIQKSVYPCKCCSYFCKKKILLRLLLSFAILFSQNKVHCINHECNENK